MISKLFTKYLKETRYKILSLLVISFLLFFIQLDIKIYTGLFFSILFFIIYIFSDQEYLTLNLKISDKVIFFLILIFVFLLQNKYLDYEIISIDIPSYLVASQNVGLSELPYETQWDSKGPLFMYLYNFISFLSQDDLVFFKLSNDILLFFVSFILYKSSLIHTNQKLQAIFPVLFFLSVTSYVWYISEYSELYCLVFISIHYYVLNKYRLSTYSVVFASSIISLSSLINQSTAIFFFVTLLIIYVKNEQKIDFKYFFYAIFSFITPHLFFILLYQINDLLVVYILNYIEIPFGYVRSGNFEIYELIVWLKRYFEYSALLYSAILFLGSYVIYYFLNQKFRISEDLKIVIFFIFLSLLIYVIAGHNYQHHLFYFIYFISLLISNLKINYHSIFLYFLIAFSFSQTLYLNAQDSINNLMSVKEISKTYPLKTISGDIKSALNKEEFTVLAFDHLLILYYLEKQNSSYIIHPYNNYEEYIVSSLINSNLLVSNEISHFSYYIEKEPDVIICNPWTIVLGNPTQFDGLNCEISDYKKNYKKLSTLGYLNKENREFFLDPYKEVSVYIRNS